MEHTNPRLGLSRVIRDGGIPVYRRPLVQTGSFAPRRRAIIAALGYWAGCTRIFVRTVGVLVVGNTRYRNEADGSEVADKAAQMRDCSPLISDHLLFISIYQRYCESFFIGLKTIFFSIELIKKFIRIFASYFNRKNLQKSEEIF
jgi:hypothetical protein